KDLRCYELRIEGYRLYFFLGLEKNGHGTEYYFMPIKSEAKNGTKEISPETQLYIRQKINDITREIGSFVGE
ncbi:MAG: hypothetical protein V1647_01775, partial [Pseudomonadota bacterium]